MKKDKQNEELYKAMLDANGNASFPELYLKEKIKREDMEKRYNLLIDLIKQEGCDRVSQQIKDELEAHKRLH
jgi:hypothetical protein